ncbi:MAG TPA: Smr/MutS family protein [Stellaceae bacterium]|nr:Smr/MutS family protein [Stellaceae bacterium]
MMRKAESDERALWREAMRGVKRLDAAAIAAAPEPDPAPPRKAGAVPPPEKPVLVPRPGLDRRSAQRLKRGRTAIDARLDLHGMTQAEAHRALAAFLARAQNAGQRVVLVITGKSGVLFGAVPRWLGEGDNRARVLASARAQPGHGGQGALYIFLRRKR